MEALIESNEPKKCRFKINKNVAKLVVYVFMIFMTGRHFPPAGCIYWGWSGIQDLLYKAGSFEELCENAPDATMIKIGEADYIGRPPRMRRLRQAQERDQQPLHDGVRVALHRVGVHGHPRGQRGRQVLLRGRAVSERADVGGDRPVAEERLGALGRVPGDRDDRGVAVHAADLE